MGPFGGGLGASLGARLEAVLEFFLLFLGLAVLAVLLAFAFLVACFLFLGLAGVAVLAMCSCSRCSRCSSFSSCSCSCCSCSLLLAPRVVFAGLGALALSLLASLFHLAPLCELAAPHLSSLRLARSAELFFRT